MACAKVRDAWLSGLGGRAGAVLEAAGLAPPIPPGRCASVLPWISSHQDSGCKGRGRQSVGLASVV
eukprot:6260715-Pyramimonas_sp.AAC.1